MYLTRVDSLDICSFLHCYKTQQFCKKLSWFSRNVQRPIPKQIATQYTLTQFRIGNFLQFQEISSKFSSKAFTILHTQFQYFRSQISNRYLLNNISCFINIYNSSFFFQFREQLRPIPKRSTHLVLGHETFHQRLYYTYLDSRYHISTR